jgi:hypothetical protein
MIPPPTPFGRCYAVQTQNFSGKRETDPEIWSFYWLIIEFKDDIFPHESSCLFRSG